MHINYFDHKKVTKKTTDAGVKKLASYATAVQKVIESGESNAPESSLSQYLNEDMQTQVYALCAHFKNLKHVVVIGIGGSSLGVEAVHSVLHTQTKTQLHILDTVSSHELEQVMLSLKSVKKVSDIAVVVISKSGSTTETIANAEIALGILQEQFGNTIYKQTIFIGNNTSPLQKAGKKLGAHTIAMADAIGGRYSVFTPVGLVPLLLLGHNIEAFLLGQADAAQAHYKTISAESASRMFEYMKLGYQSYNIFLFDTRLVRLGKWYRQLLAESIGKGRTKKGKANKLALLPTVSTAVELHSVGQLYFSDVIKVYTDFIDFDDNETDYQIPKKALLATQLKNKTLDEIGTAIYGGVVGAYHETGLPYRSTVFDEELMYSLGLFMSMRMYETMLVAELLQVDAFDQPNVELYKSKTKSILGVS